MRWRRLDIRGTDECELVPLSNGWRIQGVAEFGTGPEAGLLRYIADSDREWRTIRGEVHGVVGALRIALVVERESGDRWRVNGVTAPALSGLVDLDFGFTPATNLFPLRRLSLGLGQRSEAEAAWLDDTSWTFSRLPQRYERRGSDAYWYESPSAGYEGLLIVDRDGFVREYPGLWTAVDGDPVRPA